MIELCSSKRTATFPPSTTCNTKSQCKNTHFSIPKPSEVSRITAMEEDTKVTNFGQDDGLTMHPGSIAVIAQQAKGCRQSLLPEVCNPIPASRTPGYAVWRHISH